MWTIAWNWTSASSGRWFFLSAVQCNLISRDIQSFWSVSFPVPTSLQFARCKRDITYFPFALTIWDSRAHLMKTCMLIYHTLRGPYTHDQSVLGHCFVSKHNFIFLHGWSITGFGPTLWKTLIWMDSICGRPIINPGSIIKKSNFFILIQCKHAC